jgi:hypothetical protein
MSKGSAGKVYFVLYLAVILELLIIIVERDEAEDHLRKREREAREIIQDILGQMQVGPGNENLTSRINDEISLLSDEAVSMSGIPYKKYRTYNVEVGVNDGSGVNIVPTRQDTLNHYILLRRLTNAQTLDYEVLYTTSEAAELPALDSSNDARWKPLGAMTLALDTAQMQQNSEWRKPIYQQQFANAGSEELFRAITPSVKGADTAFAYNFGETEKIAASKGGKYTKRVFTVNFQPTQPGWYKLRFGSRTNRIMGVSGEASSFDDISDDARVNIGSMQLTVKKLRKVQQMLQRELESYGTPPMDALIAAKNEEQTKAFFDQMEAAKAKVRREKANENSLAQEICRKIDLYADVAKLIAPNKSQYFSQNAGAMEINVRVTKPPVAIVKANIALPKDVYLFDQLTPRFRFTAGPFYGNNLPKGEIVSADGKSAPLVIEPVALADNSPKAASLVASNKGKSIEFTARALQALPKGTYTIRMKHTSQGDETQQETQMRIYPSQLTVQSRRILEGRLKSLFFGSTLAITLEPDAGGTLPPNEFRTFVGLSTSPQPVAPSIGLTAKLPLEAKAKSAWVRLTWISPFTGEEVEILPKLEQPVKQREPDIDMMKVAVTGMDGDWRELRVQISGIQVSPSVVDVGNKYGTPENLENVSIVGAALENTADVELISSDLKDLGNGLYSAIFKVRSILEKQPKEMSANIKFSIYAGMRNTLNGTPSKQASFETSIPFAYTPPPVKGKKR